MCESALTLRRCAHLLTPKQREMWEQRIKEESIPVCNRFHCPNPKCWALMSKTELTESTDDGVRRCCSKCRKPFCIDCNVSWHSNLSCKEYKMKGNKATTTVWRQCRSCQHNIKLSEERINVWLYVLLCVRSPMEAWRLFSSSPIGDETGGRFYGLHCPHFSFFLRFIIY
ncbi:putative IBR domain, E3 ubiquitin ligase RBR family [Arabidopsis thaliana]